MDLAKYITDEEQQERLIADAIASDKAGLVVDAISAVLRARGIVEFDGPPCATIFDRPYVTLVSRGVKAEGEHVDGMYTSQEAWALFWLHLRDMIENATQIAWRVRPAVNVSVSEKRFMVRARLAVY